MVDGERAEYSLVRLTGEIAKWSMGRELNTAWERAEYSLFRLTGEIAKWSMGRELNTAWFGSLGR